MLMINMIKTIKTIKDSIWSRKSTLCCLWQIPTFTSLFLRNHVSRRLLRSTWSYTGLKASSSSSSTTSSPFIVMFVITISVLVPHSLEMILKSKKSHKWTNIKKESHPSSRPLLPTQNPGRGTLWDFPPLQNTIGTSAIHHRGFQINWKRRPKSKEQRVGKTWNKEAKCRFWQNVAGSTCHVALRQNGSAQHIFSFSPNDLYHISHLGYPKIFESVAKYHWSVIVILHQ